MADNSNSVFEYRGVQDLYYAQVLEDSEEKFVTTTPHRLAYVATIAKKWKLPAKRTSMTTEV